MPTNATTPGRESEEARVPVRWGLILTVWFLVSAAAAIGLLALQGVIGADPVAAVMFAPAIGAGVCWMIWRSRTVPVMPAASGRSWLSGLLLALGYGIIATAVMALASGGFPVIDDLRPGHIPVIVFLLAQALGAMGEELGFRGVLLHNLGARLPQVAAVLITGVLFGLWHVQYYSLGLPAMGLFVLGTIALTATAAVLMVGSFWQRMTTAALIHLALNLAGTMSGASLPWFALAAIVGAVIIIPVQLVIGLRSSTAT